MKTNRKNKKNKYEDSDEDYSLSSEYVEEIEEESEYTEEIENIKNENNKTAKKNNTKKEKNQKKYLGKKIERTEKKPKINKNFNKKNNISTNKNNNNINNLNINNINEIELNEPKPFNFKANYFYQNLTQNELNQISNFLHQSLQNSFLSENELSIFFNNFPNLTRGSQNLTKIIQILNELTTNKSNINSYKLIINFLINNFFMVKPSIFQVYFFPNPSNEIHVINMISTCKKTLDICVFTINSKNFYEAIKNLYERNIKIRIITDDEMAKNPTSNIYSLAALGIPVKTDDNPRYYMHHKFAVIDNSVVITGSFNWTNQAINHNQENVLFIENKDLAKKYSDEFDRIWNSFIVSISKQNAIIKCKEEEEKKKAIEKRKLIEKENKLKEKYGDDYVKYLKKDNKKKNNNNNFVKNEFYNKINYEQNIYNYNQNNFNNQFNNNKSDENLKENKSNWSCSIF